MGALPWTCRIKGNDRADRLAGKATPTSGLLLGRSDALRRLRPYLRARSQGHDTVDLLEERGMERGSANQSSLKGRDRAIVRPTNIGNHFKGNVREASERRGGGGGERIRAFPSTQILS